MYIVLSVCEILLSSPQTQDQVDGGLLGDVVVVECASIVQLLASEDEALLIGGDALLVGDATLERLDGVSAFCVDGDGSASESFDEDLHLMLWGY